MTNRDEIYKAFNKTAEMPVPVQKWMEGNIQDIGEKVSLNDKNERNGPSEQRSEEERLRLKGAHGNWSEDEYEFVVCVVNCAKPSAGTVEYHPHRHAVEVDDTGLTKNEITRQNWGLLARSE